MKTYIKAALLSSLIFFVAISSCKKEVESNEDTTKNTTELHGAFDAFDSDNFTIYKQGTEYVLETKGLPNHTSPYWSNTTARSSTGPMGGTLTTPAATQKPFFVCRNQPPLHTVIWHLATLTILIGSYTLRVPVSPSKASSTSSTGLGAIGFAISGSVIYNDEEGPNVPLDNAIGSLDYTGAHTGPQSYQLPP